MMKKQFIFMGNQAKEIICHDISCNADLLAMENLTAICSCQIDTDYNNLFIERILFFDYIRVIYLILFMFFNSSDNFYFQND